MTASKSYVKLRLHYKSTTVRSWGEFVFNKRLGSDTISPMFLWISEEPNDTSPDIALYTFTDNHYVEFQTGPFAYKLV